LEVVPQQLRRVGLYASLGAPDKEFRAACASPDFLRQLFLPYVSNRHSTVFCLWFLTVQF